MTAIRERLDNRRSCETYSFTCNGLAYTANVGRFPDGAWRKSSSPIIASTARPIPTAETQASRFLSACNTAFRSRCCAKPSCAIPAVHQGRSASRLITSQCLTQAAKESEMIDLYHVTTIVKEYRGCKN